MRCELCDHFMKHKMNEPCGHCLQPLGIHRLDHPHEVINQKHDSDILECDGFFEVPKASPLKIINSQEALRRMVG